MCPGATDLCIDMCKHRIGLVCVFACVPEWFCAHVGLIYNLMEVVIIFSLHRECLDLFPTPSRAVQTELNLIASLSLLDDFGVAILPLQVH